MNKHDRKKSLLWWRQAHLELTKLSLMFYAKEKNTKYKEFAKFFGQRSKEIGEEYNQLS